MAHLIEQIELTKALRESEERYRTLVELCPEAVIVNTRDQVVFVNSAAVDLYGANQPQGLLGKDPMDLVHPDYHRSSLERFVGIVERGYQVPNTEILIACLDGRTRVVESAGAPMVFEGEPAAMFVLRDITHRKEAQDARARREQQFRQLIQQASDPIYLIDQNGYMVDVNDSVCNLLGYNREDLVGASVFTITDGVTQADLDEIRERPGQQMAAYR